MFFLFSMSAAGRRRGALRLAGALGALFLAVAPVRGSGAETLQRARESHASGRTDDALRLYLEAREELRQEGDEAAASICLNNASVILYDQGSYRRALELAREAAAIRHGLGDELRRGRSLTNAGRALRELGRFEEAQQALLEALSLAADAGDRRDQVINLVNLGVLAQQEGRYGDALDAIRRGLLVVDETADAGWAPRQRLLLLNNRGALYERIGEYRLALADYQTILDLVGDGIDSVPYRINAATVLRNLGDPNLAIDQLRDAERVLLASGGPAALHANLLSNIGIALHRNLGRLDEAGEVLERGYRLARESGDAGESMMVGNALAALYLDQGRVDAADRVLQEVLEARPGGPFLESAWESHLAMGRVDLARGERQEALRALYTSIALIEGSRRNLAGRFVPRRFLRERIDAYALLADTLAQDGDVRAALAVAQRARERLLLARQPQPSPAGDWEAQLRSLSLAAVRARDGRDAAALQEWRDLERAWASSPGASLPESVPTGEAILVYLLAEDHARVFWMSAAGVGSVPLPPESRIGALADDWLDALVTGDPREAVVGHDLFGIVLEPVLAAMPEGIRRLSIVPDGPLGRVPLDALPRSPAGDVRVLETYEIRLLPYVVAGADSRPRSTERARFVFFGPPAELPEGVPPLPQAAGEADALRAAVGPGGSVSIGLEATEANLRATLGHAVGILHVATHATFDRVDPGRTGILLQPGSTSPPSRRDDGFLSLPEIGDQRIDVDLTFLSACSGAAGEPLPGEGVESLGGLLFDAGSRAVVASLWDVEDSAATVLVEQFYHRIGQGQTIGEALREAKLAMLRSRGGLAAPRRWASWILLGEGDLRIRGDRPGWPGRLVLPAAILLLLALTGLVVRRLSSRTARS